MSYMPGGSARALADLLESYAERDGLDLSKGESVVGFLEMIFDWFVALAQYIKKTVNLRNREYQYA